MAAAALRPGSTSQPSGLRPYLAAVTVSGLFVFCYAVYSLGHLIAAHDMDGMRAGWVLGGLVVAGELRPLLNRHENDGANASLAFAIVMMAVVGWQATAVAIAGAATVHGIVKEHAAWRTAFNVAQNALSLLAAAAFYSVLGRRPDSLYQDVRLTFVFAAVLVGAAVVYSVVNHLFVWTALAIQRNQSLLDLVRAEGWHQVRAVAAIIALTPLACGVAMVNVLLMPLFLPVLLIIHGNAAASRKREWEISHDPLTQLPNRKLLRIQGEQVLADAFRAHRSVALLLFDLDRFKEVNDTLGHLTGDELLKLVATRLSNTIYPQDILARLGGDEFAVLLPEIGDVQCATMIARRIASTFADPFSLDGVNLELEVSVGVAIYPEHADEFEQLLQRADVAMYQAKRSRTTVEYYEAGRDENTPDRLALLGDLRRALDAGEVQLHYQPKVSFATGQVVGFEGLVRWEHVTRGSVNPEEFVKLAEQTGLMPKLTSYVVDQALTQVAKWWRAGLAAPVAVNVSMRDIHSPGFVQSIQSGLLRHGVPPAALQLEITERVLLEDPQRAAATLSGLDALGVRLSLDDFGTGYSSLVLLRKIPVSEIKIDKSFVARLAHDQEDEAIVRSTVDLAHSLNLRVVAEGVEDEATWDRLAELGCDAAQGWLVAKALPGDEATAWLVGQYPASQLGPGRAPAPAVERDWSEIDVAHYYDGVIAT
ncbi:MAG TPA: bifunctional diguanylate cyclase/phosphodiesterase [Actinocrinis sp.]|nr:bifunctional diguanylate cyclase/phosphodiesterase [Actinocrinis sp.]